MGRPNFIELPTRDLATSQHFFETVFGMNMTGFGPSYACTLTGDVDIGLQADPSEATKAPLPVIEVKDLEGTLAAVVATGASIVKPIFSFPGGRRFHFLDPSGNELSAMQPDQYRALRFVVQELLKGNSIQTPPLTTPVYPTQQDKSNRASANVYRVINQPVEGMELGNQRGRRSHICLRPTCGWGEAG